MNKKEALEILGFNPGDNPSKKDLNKKFRKLTAKYHPDICKEEGADERFKKMSSAYEFLKNPPAPEPQIPFNRPRRPGPGFGSGWSYFIKPRELVITLHLTFKESVLGTKKKLDYTREVPCNSCHGSGTKITEIMCDTCEGRGFNLVDSPFIIHNNINVKARIDCSDCLGSGYQVKKCSDCSGNGSFKEKQSFEFNVPGGGKTGKVLRFQNKGNVILHLGHRSVGDLVLLINAEEHPDMSIVGNDVISNIEIDLLDALKGTTLKAHTVLGEVDLKIPAKTKNKDQVKVPEHGVHRKKFKGSHIFNVTVNYPKDIKPLVEALEKENQENGI